jgi:hypothetical protein
MVAPDTSKVNKLFFFFFLAVLRFELRASHMLGRCSILESPFFMLSILEIGSCNLFSQAGLEP